MLHGENDSINKSSIFFSYASKNRSNFSVNELNHILVFIQFHLKLLPLVMSALCAQYQHRAALVC